jgi:predicted HicB family RNase H-like nuclease
MTIYRLNPHAILFHDLYDKINNYSIYVFNPKTYKIRLINSTGYQLLKTIEAQTTFTQSELLHYCKTARIEPKKFQKFINLMISENVIIKKITTTPQS